MARVSAGLDAQKVQEEIRQKQGVAFLQVEGIIPTKKADNCCHSFAWYTIEPTKIDPILKPSTPIQKPSRQPTANS